MDFENEVTGVWERRNGRLESIVTVPVGGYTIDLSEPRRSGWTKPTLFQRVWRALSTLVGQ